MRQRTAPEKIRDIEGMILRGCTVPLIRAHLDVSKNEVTWVRRRLEAQGRGKEIQYQPRTRERGRAVD